MQDTQRMRNLDFEFCRNIYENYYSIPLKFETICRKDLPNYVKTTPDFTNLILVETDKEMSKYDMEK